MPGIDIGHRHRRHLHAPEGGPDVGGDLLAIGNLCARPLAWDVIPLEPVAEISNSGGRPRFSVFANWIGAAIDWALQALGFLARCRSAPIWKLTDGDPTLQAVTAAPIVQNETARSRCGHAQTKAAHPVVVIDLVAGIRSRHAFDRPIGQSLRHKGGRVSTVSAA